jgi:hypothetical protein
VPAWPATDSANSGGSPGPRIIRCAFPKGGGNWGLTVASHLSFSISFKMNCAVNYTATVEVDVVLLNLSFSQNYSQPLAGASSNPQCCIDCLSRSRKDTSHLPFAEHSPSPRLSPEFLNSPNTFPSLIDLPTLESGLSRTRANANHRHCPGMLPPGEG